MTLLAFDGCQDAQLFAKPEWDAVVNGTITNGRDGSAGGAARIAGVLARLWTPPSTMPTAIFGFAWLVSSLGNANNYIGFTDTAGTVQIVLFINSSGFIELRRTNATGTLLATSSGHTPIANGDWHGYQIKCALSTTSATVTVKLDDVQVLTFTGVTSSTNTDVKSLQFRGFNASLDDLYACDTVNATATQGLANNDFLGDVRVQTLLPTAAGDTTQMTPSTGANYTTVDEVPPVTTDYVSDTVVTDRDLYNVNDLTGTILSVFGVREILYASKSDAGGALLKPVIKENSVVTAEAGQGLSFGSWTGLFSAFYWRKPSASTVWTSSDVNALQIGQEVA